MGMHTTFAMGIKAMGRVVGKRVVEGGGGCKRGRDTGVVIRKGLGFNA